MDAPQNLKLSLVNISVFFVLAANILTGDSNGVYGQELSTGKILGHIIRSQVQELSIDKQNQADQGPYILLPASPSRVKRESNDESCRRVSKPTTEITNSFLVQLLDASYRLIAEHGDIQDAILFLGDDESGKTELAKILTGDLSKMYMGLTETQEFMIIDEETNNRESISHPQIYFKHDNSRGIGNSSPNSTIVLSVPSLKDLTNPTHQDLARHFLLDLILNKVTNVKLLFLLPHSSLQSEGYNMKIDSFIAQAINIVKNIPPYENSIGLIITKVSAYDEWGQYISDLSINTDITSLLEIYKIDLESQLERTANPIVKRKLKFLENLIVTNAKGEYGRIAFSRNPDKCGVLSNSTIITETRDRITQLCSENLEYGFMDPIYFNFSLENIPKLGLILKNLTTVLNSLVSSKILILMNDFKNWHENKLLQMTGDIALILHELKVFTSSMEALMGNLTSLGSNSKPQNVLDKISLFLEGLGYKVSLKVEKFMIQEQALFEWLHKISPEPTRSLLGWVRPVVGVQNQGNEYLEWYEFCENLQTTVEAYDWQLKKPKYPKNDVDWLEFLEKEALISVTSNIRDIHSSLKRAHVEVFKKILKFALREVEVKCEGDTATITGNFVRLTEFMSASWPFITQCDSAVTHRHVEVYVTHTLFLDRDVDATGMELNVVMVAPNWVVVGGNRRINLNGSQAFNRNPDMAESGPNSNDGVGFRGHDGLGGLPGGPGGSLFGLALHIKGTGRLQVTSIGGKGGTGQHGGNGGRGGKHRDATFADSRKSPDSSGNAFQHRTWYDHEGFSGYPGGSGGDGGASGEGGQPGKVTILIKVRNHPSKIAIISNKGTPGEPGRGGDGGSVGSHGNGIHCAQQSKLFGLVKSKECSARNYAYGGNQNGPNGVKGRSSLGLITARPPNYSIVEWQSILNFKMSAARQVINNETRAFLQFLEKDPTLGNFFNIHGYIQELEHISELSSMINVYSMLSSYIIRVESYQKNNPQTLSTDEEKVITYLLMTAQSKLLALEPNHGMGIVVDVRRYFDLVHSEMEKFKSSSALVAINEEQERFKESLKKKIEEVRNFQNNVVTPAIQHAEVKLKAATDHLARQLENIILHNKDKFMSYKKSMTIALSENDKNAKVSMAQDLITIGLKLGEAYFRRSSHFSENDVKSCVRLINNIDSLVSSNSINRNNKTNRAIFCLGEDTVTHLFYKFKGDASKVAGLNALIKETEENLEDVCNRKFLANKSFFPVVESLRNSLVWMISEHQNKSETGSVEIPELGIRQWQVSRALRDLKTNLSMFGKSVDSTEFANALDRIQDALTMLLNLFEFIVKYEETEKLVEYVTAVNSASLKNVHVKDPTLSSEVSRMEKAMAEYYLRKVYHRAVHAFKQWVFPFAKLHLTKNMQLEEEANDLTRNEEEVKTGYLTKLTFLKRQLDTYSNATTSNLQDSNIIHTVFSSDYMSSTPFFVWKNDKYLEKISELLSGQPVMLEADVRQSQKGRDAVKFRQIEIHFKIPPEKESQTENLQRLNSTLQQFGVLMVHSGVSYYRFQENFYVMVGDNQTIRYNFEEDREGNRLGRNQIYEKFKSGDYLLSPYTLWTFQLIRTSPGSSQLDFQALKRFAPHVDLELVGRGIFVDVERMVDDMDVEKYYEKDDSVKDHVEL